MSWTMEIPMATPSANVMLRSHWAKTKKLKELWRLHLQVAGALGIPEAEDKRRVKVTRFSPGKPDYANLWTGIDKLIFDNLTRLGVLVDDSPIWLEPIVESKRGPARTIIEISENGAESGGARGHRKVNGDSASVR